MTFISFEALLRSFSCLFLTTLWKMFTIFHEKMKSLCWFWMIKKEPVYDSTLNRDSARNLWLPTHILEPN